MAAPNEKRTKWKKRKGFRRRMLAGSFLLSRTAGLSGRCGWSFRHGIASGVLCSADRTERAFREGAGSRLLQKIGFRESVSGPIRKAVATGACESGIFAWVGRVRHAFLHTKARFFGIAGLVFALYTAGIFLAKRYMGLGFVAADPADLCIAAAAALVSVLLLPCGKPLNVFFSESRLFRRVLIGMLGVYPDAWRQGTERVSARGGIAFVVGNLAGLATVFYRPHLVLLFVFAALFCLCIPAVPEMGLLSAVIVLPFAPLRLTAFLTALAALGYLQKYFRLKRVFRFRLPELLLLLTVGVTCLSAVGTGELFTLKRILLFACIWFLTVSLITTERLFRKYVAALLYGGLLTLLLAAADRLLGFLSLETYRSCLPTGMSETVLGCYLLMLMPIALLHGKRRSGILLLMLICLHAYLLQSMWVFLGLLFSVLLYAALAHDAWIGSALIGVLTLPVAVQLMGDRLGRVASGFSETAHVLARKYWFSGIGAGNHAWISAALSNGLQLDGFAAGLYTRLTLEGGVATVLLFVGTAFFALQRLFTCLREEENARRRILCGGLAAAALLFVVAAAVTDVWSDLRILGVFWCLCPAASLTGELYGFKREKEDARQWI